MLAVACALAGLSGYLGFAVPPTPQPLQFHEAGIKPGGFLPGMFQVGSGASGSDPELPQETPVMEGIDLKSPDVIPTSATQRLLSNTAIPKIFTHSGVSYLAGVGVAATILAITCHMMAGAAAPAPRDFNYRVPPA